MDYYTVLNIPRTATEQEILEAYRQLAILLNPWTDNPPMESSVAMHLAGENILDHLAGIPQSRQWDYINMAYDTLGNPSQRALYDLFGDSLQNGIVLPNGLNYSYKYDGDNMRTFKSVFKNITPHASIPEVLSKPLILYPYTRIDGREKHAPLEKTVDLSLEEVYNGCVKRMTVYCMRLNEDNLNPEQTPTTFTLDILPGTVPGTRFRFIEEGDQHPSRITGDVVFVTEDKPHPVFERINQYDLLHVRKITLRDAMVGFKFTIETLDQRKLDIDITDVVKPDYSKVIPFEGLPKSDHKNDIDNAVFTGQLIIKFEVMYPTYVNLPMKVAICSHMKQINYPGTYEYEY